MKVLLDTNIIISAGVFGGGQLSELTLKIAEEFNLVLSSTIIKELWEVMERKFPKKKPMLERSLKRLSYEISYTPTEIDADICPKIRDKKRLSYFGFRNYCRFITGDGDFGSIDIERPEIMKITDFAKKYL